MTGRNHTQVSSIQIFFLLVGFLYGSTAILNPAILAKKDAWMALILSWLGGVVLISMYVKITTLNKHKSFVFILKECFGKRLGKHIGMLYVWYFIHLSALVFRNFGVFIVTVTFPETPMIVIISLLGILVIYSVRSGIEVIGRVSEILVPLLPIAIALVSMALISERSFTNFFPILEEGLFPVLKASFSHLIFPYGETVVFLMIFPHINAKENLKQVSYKGVSFAFLIFFTAVCRDIMVLGEGLLERVTYPPHITSKMIPGISIEPVVDMNLLIGGGIKISILIYAVVKIITEVFAIEERKPLVTAIVSFCVMLSIWVYEDSFYMTYWAREVWPYYSLPFQIFIPLIVLFISLYKNNKDSTKVLG